ncbi:hypothetical protein TYRP_008643 [Tyrophagus putrescentiae]|nr:hypothetical protein TYRP_008643 [Tyrophagus putrescentiae]
MPNICRATVMSRQRCHALEPLGVGVHAHYFGFEFPAEHQDQRIVGLELQIGAQLFDAIRIDQFCLR